MFFGYYLSLAVMTREENSPPVPELARRMITCSCSRDPVRVLVPVLASMPEDALGLRWHYANLDSGELRV